MLLDYRRMLSDGEYQKRNEYLCQSVLKIVREKDFKTIHTFLPIRRNGEPDMTPIFKTLWDEGRRIMVSKTDFESKVMAHFWLELETKLEINRLGIPEPINAKPTTMQEADAILVPLLAGDKHGSRIGYGGGFYDRLLANYTGESIGLSLATLFDHLGTEEWDVPVSHVLFYSLDS